MQMDPLLQASPQQCAALARRYEDRGERYQGVCMAGEADGFGEWKSGGGHRYLGEGRKGQASGWGTFTQPDGGSYVGDWEADRRHGQGTQMYASVGGYLGEWRECLSWAWHVYVGRWR
jgi:hypothetical protein